MKMQDKEFDELFHSKLNDFEVEPSAHVWGNISEQLDAGKRRNALITGLSIAASFLILVTAGILFSPQKNQLNTKHLVKSNITKISGNLSNVQIANTISKKSTESVKPVETALAVSNTKEAHRVKAFKQINTGKRVDPIIEKSDPGKTVDRLEFTSLNKNQQDIVKPVVPDESTELAVKQPVEIATSFITKPILMSAQIPDTIKPDIEPVKPKHKIHNLGDLINVVVAKVDKRKDKIIEFTDTDDDGSNITGVNLGIIKLKKEK